MRPKSPMLVACLLPVLLAACSSSKLERSDIADSGAVADYTSTYVDTSTPSSQTAGATHYAIQGTLQTADDDVDLASSVLTFEFNNPQSELDVTGPMCASNHTLLEALPQAQDPESNLVAWWQLTLDQSEDCPDYVSPETFKLGIGPYDPLLDPAAASAGIDGQNVYGLYLQLDEDTPLLVFGVSGTSDNFSGLVAPSAEAPLPDGLYSLHTLYLLPLEPN